MEPRFRILVVDDDLKNIQVGINFLKNNENYHLVFATSGEQALARVAETDFDLVLLDIIMPTMDGYEVCKRLKSDDKTKEIPVIFLTAKHGEESLIQGFELGGADYITKPFNAAELNARVKTHLQLHHHYKQEISKIEQMLMYSQKAETVKFIAGSVAHDCNNFLSSIPVNMFMLQKQLEKPRQSRENCQELFDGVQTAISKVSGLLKQLFGFSSRDQTRQEIVDMNEVVSDLQKLFKDHIKHNISFEVTILSQPALTFADKLHVEQVLLNILINAQHAILERSKDQQEKGYILLAVEKADGRLPAVLGREKDYLRITIEDNGTGMSQETMQKIFEPHFSTRLDKGGSGLGLAVSLGIVNSHQGTIEVESKPGEGTCFSIYLPSHYS